MITADNGTYVTRAELFAHLTPITADVAEIKEDVKTLLGNDAGRRAIRASMWQVLMLLGTLFGGAAILLFHF